MLDVQGLTVEIVTSRGTIRPVQDVSLTLRAGETVAIVGESGSGKSVAATAVMGLLPPQARAVAGHALMDGRDLLDMPEPELRQWRGSRLAMVFQDPMSSLNPVLRVGEQLREAIQAHQPGRSRRALHDRSLDAVPARRHRRSGASARQLSRTRCPAACASA